MPNLPLTADEANLLLEQLDYQLEILIDDHYEGHNHRDTILALADLYDKIAATTDLPYRADAYRTAVAQANDLLPPTR